MNKIKMLYEEHICHLQARTQRALQRENLSSLVIHSGQAINVFLDDQHYAFKVNPHFKHWLPLVDATHCWLILNGVDKPILVFYQPVDFWHKVKPLPDEYWSSFFSIKVITSPQDVDQFLPNKKNTCVYVGAHAEVARALGFEHINNEALLNYLHFHRAYKTKYEQCCLRLANKQAVKAHQVVKTMFGQGASEYEINHAYLSSITHNSHQLPYDNIVALNQHSAILHYTDYDTLAPDEHISLLIDAGASVKGYGADITRTYSAANTLFSQLITAVDNICIETVKQLKPGVSYVNIHKYAYAKIADLLVDSELINTTNEQAIEQGLVSYFFPHGIGHQLGLQTHDVGGFMLDERGTQIGAPKQHPFLRCTRMVEANQVLTIEPGLYFIDSLLSDLKASRHKAVINWRLIDKLRPYGGIRIEDNIIVHQSHNENVTRDQEFNQ